MEKQKSDTPEQLKNRQSLIEALAGELSTSELRYATLDTRAARLVDRVIDEGWTK